MKDENLEKGFINCVLSNPDSLDEVIEKIDENDFSNTIHKKIFKRIKESYFKEGRVSRTKVLMFINDKFKNESEVLIEELVNTDYALPFEINDIVGELNNYKNQRTLHEAYKESYQHVIDHNISITERQSKVQDAIFQATSTSIGQKLISTADEIAMECLENMIEREEGITEDRIRTGIYSIDKFMNGGFRRNHISVLGGGTSMGKTAMALNIVKSILSQDIPTYIVSLELDNAELLDRLMITKSLVSANDYYNSVDDEGNKPLNDKQKNAIEIARSWVSEKPLMITDERGLTVEDIKSLSRKADNMLDGKLGLILIDYLTEIKITNDGNLAKSTGEAVRDLRGFAKELNCHVMLLHQINREYKNRSDKRPVKSDLRDSGEIEEKVDNLFFVYRPEYFEQRPPGEQEPLIQNDVEFIIAKQRGGKTGSLNFVWYPEIQLFQDAWDYYKGSGKVYYLKNDK